MLERAKLLNLHRQILEELVCVIGVGNAIKSKLMNGIATLARECSLPTPLVLPRYGSTILVVEDDAFVRNAACELLRESGFGVLESESATAARVVFSFNRAIIDAVFCDAILPDANGVELCREFRLEAPTVRVIVTSGYPVRTQSAATATSYFLCKPYSADQLIEILQRSFANDFEAGEFLSSSPITDRLEDVSG